MNELDLLRGIYKCISKYGGALSLWQLAEELDVSEEEIIDVIGMFSVSYNKDAECVEVTNE